MVVLQVMRINRIWYNYVEVDGGSERNCSTLILTVTRKAVSIILNGREIVIRGFQAIHDFQEESEGMTSWKVASREDRVGISLQIEGGNHLDICKKYMQLQAAMHDFLVLIAMSLKKSNHASGMGTC
jgi:hypothetical protein